MVGIGYQVGAWILAVIALAVVIAFVVRTVVSIRQIARSPAASLQALRLHDKAVGSVGRAVAVVAYLLVAIAPSFWGPGWGPRAGGWVLGIVGVATVGTLVLLERRWPVPGGTVRSASLQRRGLADVLPRAGVVLAGFGLLLGIGSMVACGVIGQFGPGLASAGASGASPADPWVWPTWQWALPLWIGSVAIAAAVGLAVGLLLRRPALAGRDRGIDLEYRRSGVDRLLRIVAFYGFWTASFVVNQVRNAVLDRQYALSGLLTYVSLALILAGLASIEIFRARPPQPHGRAGASLPAAAR